MANSYTQLYIHLIFACQFRQSLISPNWEEELHKYTVGCFQGLDQLVIEINSMPDHLHTLIRMKPNVKLCDLVREVKKSTTTFVKKNRLSQLFSWQDGYGGFSCHHKDVDYVRGYIKNQKSHHEKETFSKEYPRLLREANIPHEDQYLFQFFD